MARVPAFLLSLSQLKQRQFIAHHKLREVPLNTLHKPACEMTHFHVCNCLSQGKRTAKQGLTFLVSNLIFICLSYFNSTVFYIHLHGPLAIVILDNEMLLFTAD